MTDFLLYPELLPFSWKQTESKVEIHFRLPEHIQKVSQFKENVKVTTNQVSTITVTETGKSEPFINRVLFEKVLVQEEIQWEKIDRDLIFVLTKERKIKWNYLFKKELEVEKELSDVSLNFFNECNEIFKKEKESVKKELENKLLGVDLTDVDGDKELQKGYFLQGQARDMFLSGNKEEGLNLYMQAFERYLKSAQKGNIDARIRLFKIYSTDEARIFNRMPNSSESISYLKYAAVDNEDDWAQFSLARMISDKKYAVVFFTQSAKQGNGSGMYELGAYLHLFGKDLKVGDSVAKNWFQIGFDRGHPKCAYGLGTIAKLNNQSDIAKKYFELACFWDPVACPFPKFEEPKEEKKEDKNETKEDINEKNKEDNEDEKDNNEISNEKKEFEKTFDTQAEANEGGDVDIDDLLDEVIDSVSPLPKKNGTPKIEEITKNDVDPSLSGSVLESIMDTSDDVVNDDEDEKKSLIDSRLSDSQSDTSISKSILESIKKSEGEKDEIPKENEGSKPNWAWWLFQKTIEVGVPIVTGVFLYSRFVGIKRF